MNFRGFALVDEYAPLVFVNSADFMAAQMFTLAHELAHLFIAQSGVSNLEALQPPSDETEQFCNKAAAEFLIPEEELLAFWPSARRTNDPYQAIAHRFKVSSIVAARRALDLDLIDRDEFFRFLQPRGRWMAQRSAASGKWRPLLEHSEVAHWSSLCLCNSSCGRRGSFALSRGVQSHRS